MTWGPRLYLIRIIRPCSEYRIVNFLVGSLVSCYESKSWVNIFKIVRLISKIWDAGGLLSQFYRWGKDNWDKKWKQSKISSNSGQWASGGLGIFIQFEYLMLSSGLFYFLLWRVRPPPTWSEWRFSHIPLRCSSWLLRLVAFLASLSGLCR